jgi:hypothetical protein
MEEDKEKVLSRKATGVGISLDLEFHWSLDSLRRNLRKRWHLRLVSGASVLDLDNRCHIRLGIGVGEVKLSSRDRPSKHLDLDFFAGRNVNRLRRMSSDDDRDRICVRFLVISHHILKFHQSHALTSCT